MLAQLCSAVRRLCWQDSLALEHVYGYNGHQGRNNVFLNQQGHAVYHVAALGVARAVAWGGTGDGGGTGEGAPDCGCDVGVASSRISRTARTPRLVTVEIAPCGAKESQVQ